MRFSPIENGAVAKVDESTVSNSSFFVLGGKPSVYAGYSCHQRPLISARVSMAEKYLVSHPIFPQKSLCRKITYQATRFFYPSVYIKKNKYQVLRFILLGSYREKSLFQILESRQTEQKS